MTAGLGRRVCAGSPGHLTLGENAMNARPAHQPALRPARASARASAHWPTRHRTVCAVRRLIVALVATLLLGGFATETARAAGCDGDCVIAVDVTHGPTAATLQITTSVDATVKAWLGGSAPVDVAGSLVFLPSALKTTSSPYQGTQHWLGFGPLDTGTHYWVTLKVTDDNDHSYWTSVEFTTWRRELTVTFYKIHVINDADAGISKGEIDFDLLANKERIVSTGQDKIGSGDTVYTKKSFTFSNAPYFLLVQVYGHEFDGWSRSGDYASGEHTINLGAPRHDALPSSYGLGMPAGHDGYFVVTTDPAYLEFDVYGYYDLTYLP